MRKLLSLVFLGMLAVTAAELSADDVLKPGHRVWLDAHNCYPEGPWHDRLTRALGTGVPTAIEQDLVWTVDPATGAGRAVVSHGAPLTGNEPTLEAHFFAQLRPFMERALAEQRRDTRPLLVLHLDFKTNEPAHHEAIWQLLGRYESWLTTAIRTEGDAGISPLVAGPLLVLTENGSGQVDRFHDRVPAGSRLRLFGTVPAVDATSAAAHADRAAALVEAPASTLIPTGTTNYRRWVNFPWAVVERGGQHLADAWTPG